MPETADPGWRDARGVRRRAAAASQRARRGRPADGDERDAALLRHRVALETLRDVEADRRAGSLDDATYAEQLAAAEAPRITRALSTIPRPTVCRRRAAPARDAVGSSAARPRR